MATGLRGVEPCAPVFSEFAACSRRSFLLLQGMREAAMSITQREKKDEDEAYSPFTGLQKATVLQEGRCFNDRDINVRKCIGILTKILWLICSTG